MFNIILSSLLATSVSAIVVPSAYVKFPAYGGIQSISGTITFELGSSGTGVVISSSNETGLRGFPEGLGPFLWHGIIPSNNDL